MGRFCMASFRPRLICVKNRAMWNFVKEHAATSSEALLSTADQLCGTSGRNTSFVTAFDNLRIQAQSKGREAGVFNYPKAFVPGTDLVICRLHNFRPEGCSLSESCKHDHAHCYFCKGLDHRALDCPDAPQELTPQQ